MIEPDELVEIFRAEAQDQLEEILSLLDHPEDQWDVPQLFTLFHNVKGSAAIVEAEEIRIVAHGAEDLLGTLDGRSSPTPQLVELVRTAGKLLHALLSESPPPTQALLDYTTQIAAQMAAGSVVGSGETTSSKAAPELLAEIPSDQPTASTAIGSRGPSTIRIASSKIDGLVGLAAEVVIQTVNSDDHAAGGRRLLQRLRELVTEQPELRGRVTEPLRELGNLCESLIEAAGRLHQISDELNASVRSLRMVRIDGLNGVFARVVRESCEATGRRARFVFAPGATEIDRGLLDQLRDPLVHLLRNAVAHGIETPRERQRSGKPESGTITVTARTAGPWVELSIADDGRGISTEEIGDRALEQGLITQEALASLSEAERLALVFTARLSTQRSPNTTAGRGIGLDVVRRRIHGCGGRIAIDSELGRGTTFELRVPLTQATTRGVIVEVAGRRYILPALYVDRVFLPDAADLGQLEGKEVVFVGQETLEVSDLRALLGIPARPIEGRPLVVLGHGLRRRVVVVDEVLEERELVLQGLTWNLAAVPGVAGAAMLDGSDILLVLDAPAVIEGLEISDRVGPAPVPSTRQRRILVVDDSVTSRTLEKNILSNAGYEVVLAVDGLDAWAVLESDAIDLVISDVEMPNMDGFSLTRKIRAVERHASTPVILVTSRGGPEARLQGAESGADAYVVKGAFDQDELLQAVARLL